MAPKKTAAKKTAAQEVLPAAKRSPASGPSGDEREPS